MTTEKKEVVKKQEEPKVEAVKNDKKSTDKKVETKEVESPKKAPVYVVEIDFYSKEKPKVKYEKGRNVSHFSKERLAKLVERGIVSERIS